MSTVLAKPILLDETGQDIVDALVEIKNAINSGVPEGDPVRITIVTPPTKTQYEYDETLDLSGISVSAVFSNNYMFDITNQCTFTPGNGSHFSGIGDVPVTVSWTWHGTGQVFTATQMVEVTIDAVTWANGTDAQIAKMLEAHYAGIIDIHDYWSVGDERKVTLNAMPVADGVNESHLSQTVTYVLMNEGGKNLVSPINNVSECAFIVGQKEILGDYVAINSSDLTEAGLVKWGDVEYPYMPSSEGGWETSERRAWCNNTYKNSIPSTFRSLFKEHYNVTSKGTAYDADQNVMENNLETPVTTADYFALPSEKELTGVNTLSNSTAEGANTQFEYYSISNNRNKYPAIVETWEGQEANMPPVGLYWTRSPKGIYDTVNQTWSYAEWVAMARTNQVDNEWVTTPYSQGLGGYSSPSTPMYNSQAIAPFGVI